MGIKKPLRLKPSATIGIINPSFKKPDDVLEKYKSMVENITNRGYKIKYGKTYFAKEGYLAGSDFLRAQDVMDMFLDDEVDAIICMRGGYGASRMVDLLDYQKISEHPKIFSGFSDITVLLNSINQHANVPTIHGLVSLFLGSKSADSESVERFWEFLENGQKGKVLKNPNDKCKTLIGGKATGELVGGNLSLLATLSGGEYAVDFTDKIVFIEEVEEEPYQIDRYLSSIRLTNALKKAKGFVFGYFTDCKKSESREGTQDVLDVIKDYVLALGKPTIYDFACGHDFPFVTLPIGVEVELDADKKTIKINEEFYKDE